MIGLLYFAVCFALGLAALAAWMVRSSVAVDSMSISLVPDLVQTFAIVFLGSVVPAGVRFLAQ